MKRKNEKMKKNVVNVFLPLRRGSERVPNKNTRNFSGISGGLCKLKLNQLINCDLIADIFISTDDSTVIEIAKDLNDCRIHVCDRPSELASSTTSTDDLIKHVPQILPEGHVMWTHVTSPFISSSLYDQIIAAYFKNLSEFDSLMTVTKVQKFIWGDTAPINYDRNIEKWPRTQTLRKLWEVNSAAFITSSKVYLERADRVGSKPYLYELTDIAAYDIDWMDNFTIAEAMFSALKDKGRE